MRLTIKDINYELYDFDDEEVDDYYQNYYSYLDPHWVCIEYEIDNTKPSNKNGHYVTWEVPKAIKRDKLLDELFGEDKITRLSDYLKK